MNFLRIPVATVSLVAAGVSSAIASSGADVLDTSLTYNSGILVLAFAGFLALIVVVQTIPAIISLYGMIKAAAEDSRQQEAVKSSVRK